MLRAQVACTGVLTYPLRSVKRNRESSNFALVKYRRKCCVIVPGLYLHRGVGWRIERGSSANLKKGGDSQKSREEFSHC